LVHAAAQASTAAAVDVGFAVASFVIHAMSGLADAIDAASEAAVDVDAADGSVFTRVAAAAAAIDVGLVSILSVVVARCFVQHEAIVGNGAADRE
jgi:hypothetical protein